MAQVDEKLDEEVSVWSADGNHDVFAHYAEKDEITRALIDGIPLVALCGKIWIPYRDPEKYPICPTCKEIYEGLNE